MSNVPFDEPVSRRDIEKYYWSQFLDWLRETSFDPRNGECIDTIFWYWYLRERSK